MGNAVLPEPFIVTFTMITDTAPLETTQQLQNKWALKLSWKGNCPSATLFQRQQ
ncbi:hypothetical protein T09_11272 [Trichinella sp. T9]|nr:hypothetical protein T09_11272 [Trichinella sp. T9]